MSWHEFEQVFTVDQVYKWIDYYEGLGPLMAIGLPFLEAFFPFLPLVVFIFANAAGFGYVLGLFFSWTGSVLGALVVFGVARRIRNHRLGNWLRAHPRVQQALEWIGDRGFGFLFILYALPFTPSSLVNVVSGLSSIGTFPFVLALMLGKFVMIAMLSVVGNDWHSLLENPLKIILWSVVILVLWLLGKWVERKRV
ncbi:MAG: TVP38/TMEM64 family protein [Bacilli bacterium]